MRVQFNNAIPHDRKGLSFGEWFLSLFSEQYRKHAVEYRIRTVKSGKNKNKEVSVPYHMLWSPWKREWYDKYCALNLEMSIHANLELAKENVAALEKSAKEANVWCNNMLRSFGDNTINPVYGKADENGNVTYHNAVSKVSLDGIAPAGAPKRREIVERPKSEPRNNNNNKKQNGGNGQN